MESTGVESTAAQRQIQAFRVYTFTVHRILLAVHGGCVDQDLQDSQTQRNKDLVTDFRGKAFHERIELGYLKE